jgi:hypothetical protein
MVKFERECYCVRQLMNFLGLEASLEYRNPLEDYRRETGIDVIIVGEGRRLGFQVTEYDGGEGVAAIGGGEMRAREARQQLAAGQMGVYPGWGSPHFTSAFAARVDGKIQKAQKYKSAEVDEVWLLVSAGLPDAPIATFVPHFHIGADDLNSVTATQLEQSCFAGAFLHVIMGDAVYEWDRESRWRKHRLSVRP